MTTSNKVAPLPNHPVLSPKLAVKNADAAQRFYADVFGAVPLMSLKDKRGRVVHSELDVAGCRLMVGDSIEEYNNLGPEHYKGSPVHLHLYVEDADATVASAERAGAKVLVPVAEQFYGDRSGRFEDPFGHVWIVATRAEEMSSEELAERWAAMQA